MFNKIKIFDDKESQLYFGSVQAKLDFSKLFTIIENLNESIFNLVSVPESVHVDSVYVRDCIGELVKHYKCQKYFVFELEDKRISSNWIAGAKFSQATLIVRCNGVTDYVGEELGKSNIELLTLIESLGSCNTVDVANKICSSVQNASVRLKKLTDKGLLIRHERSSVTGGKEFIYESILSNYGVKL